MQDVESPACTHPSVKLQMSGGNASYMTNQKMGCWLPLSIQCHKSLDSAVLLIHLFFHSRMIYYTFIYILKEESKSHNWAQPMSVECHTKDMRQGHGKRNVMIVQARRTEGDMKNKRFDQRFKRRWESPELSTNFVCSLTHWSPLDPTHLLLQIWLTSHCNDPN